MSLRPGLPAPAVLRRDASLWLRERGILRAPVRVFHPSDPRGLISWKEPVLRLGRDGLVLPVLARDRRLEPDLGRHLAEGLIAAQELGAVQEIGSPWRHPDSWDGMRGFGGAWPLLEVHDAALYEILAAPQTDFITATGEQAYAVPVTWDGANNSITCVGAGGRGTAGQYQAEEGGAGGGGGACAQQPNVTLTPGGTAACFVGFDSSTASNRDTHANGASFGAASCAAKGGGAAGGITAGGGGLAGSSIGSTKRGGGNGGSGRTSVVPGPTGGGGGAGSLTGAGNNAGTGGGSSPGGGSSGSAATGGGDAGNNGGTGSQFGSSLGTGGGGGGGWCDSTSNANATSGGNGGSKGGGGAGGGYGLNQARSGGNGGNGLVRFVHEVSPRITFFMLV